MSNDENKQSGHPSGLQEFWQELRRRKVIRVATVYLITGWLIIQVADTTFDNFGIPDWAFRFVMLMVILGLPVALILAWALELTPEGIKTTRSLDPAGDTGNETKALNKRRNWTAYAFGALVPTLIFGGLAIFFYGQSQRSGLDEPAARSEARDSARTAQSIAVMPLVNMSSHEENAYFAGGIHEDVLTNLSRIKNLQVISRTSMLRYATSDKSLKEIGGELGVDYIVEGSVRRIGNHVRVTVQLINAQNDIHLWANNYERELTNEFVTQTALAREISDSIHLELQPGSIGTLEGMPTTSVKAYDLYIKAESLEKTEGENEETLTRRRAMLEQAVAEDPQYVEAWAVLKRVYDRQADLVQWRDWFIGEDEDANQARQKLKDLSERALDRAVALDPDHPETLLSSVVDHDWPKSYEEMQAQKTVFDRLIASHSDHAKSWYHLGWWHSKFGELIGQDVESGNTRAAAAFEEALRLDPFNARMVFAVLDWYRNRGYENDVTRLSERLVQIIPETAEDRSLARVDWSFKRQQIVSAFLETADESLFEDYKKGAEDDEGGVEFWSQSDSMGDRMDQWELSIFTNNEGRLLENAREPVDIYRSPWDPAAFCLLNGTAMDVLSNRGDVIQANAMAERILEQEEALLNEDAYGRHWILRTLAEAHTVTGNFDAARHLAEDLFEVGDSAYKTEGVGALARLDADRAAEVAFEELERNPNWIGFDMLAAFHISSRAFLTHPRVQEYYVSEGKWIDYLAARVPEYSKYKRTAAE